MRYKIAESDMLVVVDLQNDFCPGGKLAVPQGDEIASIVNRLGERFRHVVLSQDWHPALHKSFASAHPGRQPFETVSFAYGPQVLWPDHCVQGTPGAQFSDALDMPHAELVLRKGYRREIDSYSVFYENDHTTPTGLAGYLRERGFKRVFLVGLALDVCVRYSAEDAHRCGLEAVVIEEACRGIDVGGSMAAARQAFARLAIACVGVEAID
ncbi:MAG TPA: bifunctional nicotinamidase/pyrazinamidase [Hyphomicrobiaceae bacterium]|jgi:nicotinamidase/pyrazinamidase|nr:bifunctional nicotinamidase/pyrazinamidase [Hyphomicrobiaceae bacterium]